MRNTCRTIVLAIAMACLLPAIGTRAQTAPLTAEQAREDIAYTLGKQAYVYGYPWVYLPTLRYIWVTKPINPVRAPYAAINHFWHLRQLGDAEYRNGGSPNNDTLYSVAWVDVSAISRSFFRIPT